MVDLPAVSVTTRIGLNYQRNDGCRWRVALTRAQPSVRERSRRPGKRFHGPPFPFSCTRSRGTGVAVQLQWPWWSGRDPLSEFGDERVILVCRFQLVSDCEKSLPPWSTPLPAQPGRTQGWRGTGIEPEL